MKTKIFKFVLPIAFVALGIFGAFSSSAMEREMANSGAVWGYKKIISSHPCEQVQQCDQVNNFLCKGPAGDQLYALTAPDQCPTMLFRSTP